MAAANGNQNAQAAFDSLLDIGSLVKGGRIAANWLPDGTFWYVEGAPHRTAVKLLDPASGAIGDMFDVSKVRNALTDLLGRPLPYAGLPFESFVTVGDAIRFTFEGATYRMDRSDYQIALIPGPNLGEIMFGRSPETMATPRTFVRPSYYAQSFPVPEMVSPDGTRMVGIQGHDLALHYAVDGRTEWLTQDGEKDYGWDVESMRFGPAAGGSMVQRTINPWSPDGLFLFAAKVDQRLVPRWKTTYFLKRHNEVVDFPVSRAGDPLSIVEPYVIDVLRRKATRIDIDTYDQLMLPLGWKADGGAIYFMLFSRDMKVASLYAADPVTGAAQLIHSERGETFIRIQHQVISGRQGCTLLPDQSGFIWESQADGWNHIYLYDMEGRLQRRLTAGEWPVLDVLSIDPAAGDAYFMAHHDQARPYDVQLCRVPLAGGAIEVLTPEPGLHEIQMAPDFSSFVATRSLPDLPPRSEVRRRDGTLVHVFPPADISKLDALGWTAPEQFSVKAADGVTDLWGILYKPRDFDPSKRYPVVEYIYGGPQLVYTSHGFYAPSNYAFVALCAALPALGYVVVVMDGRGTPERSKPFHDACYQNWRRIVGDDHAAGLKNLAADRLWMDMDRVGVYGHSWGGYYTFECMLDHPDVYRAGVASAPGFDAGDYFIYEPYMGGPPSADNAAAYRDALLYPEAGKLQGDLMIVAGTADTLSWENANKMVDALIRAGIDHEFVVLPDNDHGYESKHDLFFIRKLVKHFDRHLKG